MERTDLTMDERDKQAKEAEIKMLDERAKQAKEAETKMLDEMLKKAQSNDNNSAWSLMKGYLNNINIPREMYQTANIDSNKIKTIKTAYNSIKIPINKDYKIDQNRDKDLTIKAMRNAMDSKNIDIILRALISHKHSYFIDRQGRLSGEIGASLTSGTVLPLSFKFVIKMGEIIQRWGRPASSTLFICNPKVLFNYKAQKKFDNISYMLDQSILALPLPDFGKQKLVASNGIFTSYGISSDVHYLESVVDINKFFDVYTNSAFIILDYFNACIVGTNNENKGTFMVHTKDI